MKRSGVVSVLSAALAAAILLPAGCGNKAASAASAPAAGKATTVGSDPPAEAKHVEAFGIVKAKNSRAEYDAQVENKSYELTVARRELKKADLDVQKLQEDLESARADTEKAQKDLGDKEKMFSFGATSKNDVEESQRTLKTRQQKVRELERSRQEYDSGDVNGLQAKRTRVAIVEEELARLKEQSNRPYVSNDSIVCDIREAVVSEIGYAKDVKIGSAASIVPVADNARKYEGRVTRISNMALKYNGETVVPVEIAIAAMNEFLLPNFNVDVSVF